jgi:hypothetical protein
MSTEFGQEVAHRLTQAADAEWPVEFDRLRREKKLSSAVREINSMLDQPAHRSLAIKALCRIGLWYEK